MSYDVLVLMFNLFLQKFDNIENDAKIYFFVTLDLVSY